MQAVKHTYLVTYISSGETKIETLSLAEYKFLVTPYKNSKTDVAKIEKV